MERGTPSLTVATLMERGEREGDLRAQRKEGREVAGKTEGGGGDYRGGETGKGGGEGGKMIWNGSRVGCGVGRYGCFGGSGRV